MACGGWDDDAGGGGGGAPASNGAANVEMGGSVMESAALWLRYSCGRSGATKLSDSAEGDRRGGEGWDTSSALPSTDMDRRYLDDWGGGRTDPGAAEEGRCAGMNSCLEKVSHGSLRGRQGASYL